MIKKYKNGKIKMDIRYELKTGFYEVGKGHEEDMKELGNFYHNEMFGHDLYINQINGHLYICDFNTQRVYDLPRGDYELFLEDLGKGKVITLEPYAKRLSKSLLQDIENGY